MPHSIRINSIRIYSISDLISPYSMEIHSIRALCYGDLLFKIYSIGIFSEKIYFIRIYSLGALLYKDQFYRDLSLIPLSLIPFENIVGNASFQHCPWFPSQNILVRWRPEASDWGLECGIWLLRSKTIEKTKKTIKSMDPLNYPSKNIEQTKKKQKT